MNSASSFDTILKLELKGRLAHFRKFYTNASSLTYSIPPRTSVCGLVASVLKIPRDSYYDLLNSANLGVAIALPPDAGFRRQFFTMNYLGDEKQIYNVGMHKQCRLELLMPEPGKELGWILYLGYNRGCDPLLDSLKERISAQDLGYDVYLGQRQFRASITLLETYSGSRIRPVESSGYVDSAIDRERIEELDNGTCRITMERMPMEQTLVTQAKKTFRRSVRFADVIIETTGKRLCGKFTDLTELDDAGKTRIAFL